MNSASDEAAQPISCATKSSSVFCPQMLMNAGFFGFTGVLLGAMGAHFLPGFLEARGLPPDVIVKRLAQFDTGVRYHLVHAVATLALVAMVGLPRRTQQVIAGLFTIGTILFSGSLYLLVFLNQTWLGAITPLGGTVWLIAWATVFVAGWKRPLGKSDCDR